MITDKFLNEVVTILPIKDEDVETHFNIVSHVITPLPVDINDEEVITFKAKMYSAVKNKTAYKVANSDCFIYFNQVDKNTAEAACLWCKGKPIQLLLLFKYVFYTTGNTVKKLYIQPHSVENFRDYKSLAVKSTLRRWFNYKTPIVVRIDKLIEKFKKIYEARSSA